MTRNATKSLISIALAAALVAGLVPTGPWRMAHAEEGAPSEPAVTSVDVPAEKSEAAAGAASATEGTAVPDDGGATSADPEEVATGVDEAGEVAADAAATLPGGAAAAPADAATGEVPAPEDASEPAEGVPASAPERPAIDAIASSPNGVFVEVHAPKGAFEAGTTLRVSPASSEDLARAAAPLVGGRAGEARAVDISFVRDGVEVEPAQGSSVQVTLRSLFAAGGSSFKAVHLTDDGTAELVGDASATRAEFSATSFSVYGIVGEEGETRVQVTFESASTGGAMLATQIVHEGDTLTAPDAPVSPDAGKAFECWRAGAAGDDASALIGKQLNADALQWLVRRGTPTGEDNTYSLKVYASFATAHAVRLHQFPYDSSPTAGTDDVYADTLYALKGADGVFRADLSKASFTAVAAVSLMGWERREGDVVETYDKSATIEVEGPVELYPRMSSGHWVSFDTGDAPKVDAQFVAEGGKLAVESLPKATWEGYVLEGWYLDEECTEPERVTEDLAPDEDITLYAKWKPAENTRYLVLLWVEGEGGGPGEGTYGLLSPYERTGTTGATVEGVPTEDGRGLVVDGETYAIDRYHPETDAGLNKSVTIAADGTTILNLYFARDWWHVTFYNGRNLVLDAENVKWGQDVSYWFDNGTIANINRRWNASNIGLGGYTTLTHLASMPYAPVATGAEARVNTVENSSFRYQSHLRQELTYQEVQEGKEVTATAHDDLTGEDISVWEYRVAQGVEFPATGRPGWRLFLTVGHTFVTGPRTRTYDPDYRESFAEDNTAPAYTQTGGSLPGTGNGIHYYINYRLVKRDITFMNLGDEGLDPVRGIRYTYPLDEYDPHYSATKTGPYGEKWTFKGWYTSEQAADELDERQRFEFAGATMPAENLALYAGWEKPSFSITFDANGGTMSREEGATLSDDYTTLTRTGLSAGDYVDRPADPTWEGYTFAGWCSDKNLTKPWQFTSQVIRNQDVRLYAKWVKGDIYGVTYHKADGTEIPGHDPKRYRYGASVRVASAPEDAQTQPFLGWSSAPGSAGGDVTAMVGETFPITRNTHLYATYGTQLPGAAPGDTDPDAPELTLVSNYPADTLPAAEPHVMGTHRTNDDVTLPDVAGAGFTRPTAYHFAGWNTQAGGRGTSFSAGTPVAVDGDTTLYATWDANQFAVADVGPFTYIGANQEPRPVVTDGDTTLTEDVDYVLSWSNNKDVTTNDSRARVVVTGIGDYALAEPKTVTFEIERAPLTVRANGKQVTYGDAAANDGVSYEGLVGGETSAVLDTSGLAYAYNVRDDGTGAAYAAGSAVGTYRIICSGVTAANYEVSFATGTLTVEPRTVGLAWSTADPTYTGSPVSYAGATVTCAWGSDALAVDSYEGPMSATDVTAAGYTVQATALSGAKAANYALPANEHTWHVLQADNVATASITGWTYGETSVAPSVAADFGGSTATFSYADAPAGPWSAGVPTQAGTHYVRAEIAETDNWRGAVSEPVSFEIARRPVLIAGVGAADKTYDGAPDATPTGTAAPAAVEGQAASGPVAGDDLLVSGGSAAFSDKHAGATKAVTFSGWALAGSAAANYELVGQPAGVTATIEPREVTLSWSDTSFTYDAAAHVPRASAGNLVAGDSCTVTVGEAKTAAGDYTASATALDNVDYKLPAEKSVSFSIAKAPLTLTARNWQVSYPDPPANDGFDVSGFVGGETWQTAPVTGEVWYGYDYAAGDDTGTYAITLDISGLAAANYDISAVGGTLRVVAAENAWVVEPAIEGWVAGQDPGVPAGAARFGDVAFEYRPASGGAWSADIPVAAGDYVMRATVAETINWGGLQAEVPFSITPDTLTYQPNSTFAEGSTAPYEGATGDVITVAASGFSWANHDFRGWNTAADGSGDAYAPGDEYVLGTGEDQLFAQWWPTGELRYDGNGATFGDMAAQGGDAGSAVEVQPSGFSRDHWRFTGWNTAADGSGDAYAPGDAFTLAIGGNLLYAQWEYVPDPGVLRQLVLDDNWGGARIAQDDDYLAEAVELTDDELRAMSAGNDALVYVVARDVTEGVGAEERALLVGAVGEGMEAAAYLDVTLYVRLGDLPPRRVTSCKEPITVSIALAGDDAARAKYAVARLHEGRAVVVPSTYASPALTFDSDLFSIFELAYPADPAAPVPEPDSSARPAPTPKTSDPLLMAQVAAACASLLALALALAARRLRRRRSE